MDRYETILHCLVLDLGLYLSAIFVGLIFNIILLLL